MAKRSVKSDVPKRCIGYVRVSTKYQDISVEAQEAKLRASAIIRDCTMDEIIIDSDESAKSLDRPGVKRLIEMVDSGSVCTIIVCKLDRLTRKLKDLLYLIDLVEKHNVSLVSLSESLDTKTATGRMIVKILGTVGEWEREMIAERVVTALGHKRSKGERMGNVPYGYQANKNERAADGSTVIAAKLEPNPDEQAVIIRIHALRANGATLGSIANQLNYEGVTTRRHSRWKPQYVDSILKQVGITL